MTQLLDGHQESYMGSRIRTISIIVVVVLGVVNLSLCFIFFSQAKRLELKKFQTHIDKSVYVMQKINALALYNVDEDLLKTNLGVFFEDENMKSITLKDSDFGINIHLERQIYPAGVNILRSVFLDYNGVKLGKQTVVYSTGLVEKKLAHLHAKSYGFALVSTLIMTVAFVFLIKFVTRPVARLARESSKYIADILDKEYVESPGNSDFLTLSQNLAVMRDDILKKAKDHARINSMMEGQVQQKKIEEKKFGQKSLILCSVDTFFQRAMTAQSVKDIAEIFIHISQTVEPSPYCLVGQVREKDEFFNISALSRQAKGQWPGGDEDRIEQPAKRLISPGLAKVLAQRDPVISNNLSLDLFPGDDFTVDSVMAFPIVYDDHLLGLAAFAGKASQYTDQQIQSVLLLVTALAQTLSHRVCQDEKRWLEKVMGQAGKMVVAGDLAAGMAHKIKAPLADIDKAVQMIRSRVEMPGLRKVTSQDQTDTNLNGLQAPFFDPEVLHSLDMIRTASTKATTIALNLLDFCENDTGEYTSEDINQLMDRALNLAVINNNCQGQSLDFNTIQVIKNFASDLPKVKCRANLLIQVFFNILSNGAYAMARQTDNPCPTFFIITHAKDHNVWVEIRDNGPQIPENILERIFEPLFAPKADEQDLWPILSVCRFIIAQNHNGTIEVETSPDEGTCFKMSLPV